jgi:hypothetical protein
MYSKGSNNFRSKSFLKIKQFFLKILFENQTIFGPRSTSLLKNVAHYIRLINVHIEVHKTYTKLETSLIKLCGDCRTAPTYKLPPLYKYLLNKNHRGLLPFFIPLKFAPFLMRDFFVFVTFMSLPAIKDCFDVEKWGSDRRSWGKC